MNAVERAMTAHPAGRSRGERRSAPKDPRRAAPRRPEPTAPDPERLARAIAHAFLEIESGRRPLAQIERLLSPALRQRLRLHVVRPGPGPAPDAVLGSHASYPHPDACEVAVVVRRGGRAGALAIRVERHRSEWRVVELARPEDGHRPAVTRSLPWAPPPPDAFDDLDAGETSMLAEVVPLPTATSSRDRPCPTC